MVLSWFGAIIFSLTSAEGGEGGGRPRYRVDTEGRGMLVTAWELLSAGLALEIEPWRGPAWSTGVLLIPVLAWQPAGTREGSVGHHVSWVSSLSLRWQPALAKAPGDLGVAKHRELSGSSSFLSSEQPWHWVTPVWKTLFFSFWPLRHRSCPCLFPLLFLVLLNKFVSHRWHFGASQHLIPKTYRSFSEVQFLSFHILLLLFTLYLANSLLLVVVTYWVGQKAHIFFSVKDTVFHFHQ